MMNAACNMVLYIKWCTYRGDKKQNCKWFYDYSTIVQICLHGIVHFLEEGKPKYTCEICGKSYIRSWSYYGHMREHASGEKQHKCDVCGKIFNYASNLRQHMLIHTGTATCEIHLFMYFYLLVS